MTEKQPQTVADTAHDLRVGLNSVLQESIDTVKRNATVLDEQYFTPTSSKVQTFAEKNPIVFTFLAIFGFLSVIPISFALGFIALSMSMAIIGAVLFLVSILGFVLFLTTFILTPILIVTASIAMFTTGSLIALFLATRLYVLVRDNDYSLTVGVQEWLQETQERVVQLIPQTKIEDKIQVKQVVLRGTRGEDGDVDVKKVELELMNGTIKKEVDEVGLVVEDFDPVKREEPVKVYREGADSYAYVAA